MLSRCVNWVSCAKHPRALCSFRTDSRNWKLIRAWNKRACLRKVILSRTQDSWKSLYCRRGQKIGTITRTSECDLHHQPPKKLILENWKCRRKSSFSRLNTRRIWNHPIVPGGEVMLLGTYGWEASLNWTDWTSCILLNVWAIADVSDRPFYLSLDTPAR